MMRIGFIGLGKLGLPVATILAARGHKVTGYDPRVFGFPTVPDTQEEGWQRQIDAAGDRFSFGAIEEACRADVVFVAVQTPHEPAYEGTTPLPAERRDFDYSHLLDAIQSVRSVCDAHNLHPTIAVISTVLPGTMRREIIPRLGRLRLVYNPSFIAMGTVVEDFTHPEFVLLGGPERQVNQVAEVYRRAGIRPRFQTMGIESAELTKVAYNTFIGLKLAFANTIGELCEKSEANVDEVTGALKMADRRLISPAYLTAGMGDGGGCHPRDNIALSWLAREKGLSFDLFEATMIQREEHASWLAELLRMAAEERDLVPAILGIAYKPRSGLITGSPALLVKNLYPGPLVLRDPYVDTYNQPLPRAPLAWLVGCKHPEFTDYSFPKGSVIIDPWRYIPDQDGVEVVRIGE